MFGEVLGNLCVYWESPGKVKRKDTSFTLFYTRIKLYSFYREVAYITVLFSKMINYRMVFKKFNDKVERYPGRIALI